MKRRRKEQIERYIQSAKLDSGLARELQDHDGLIVTHSERGKGNARGVRIEKYKVPDGYQTKLHG